MKPAFNALLSCSVGEMPRPRLRTTPEPYYWGDVGSGGAGAVGLALRPMASGSGLSSSRLPQLAFEPVFDSEHPWRIRIRTLGLLQIEVDGQRISFGRKRPTVPLALLQLLAGYDQPLPAHRVLASLWPGYGDSAPRGTLDTALYRLRKLLGTDLAIGHQARSIELSRSLCWTDVRALFSVADRISALAGSGEPVRAELEQCERWLFELYGGPFAAGDVHRALERPRDRVQRRWERAVAELGWLWRVAGEAGRERALLDMALVRADELPQ